MYRTNPEASLTTTLGCGVIVVMLNVLWWGALLWLLLNVVMPHFTFWVP